MSEQRRQGAGRAGRWVAGVCLACAANAVGAEVLLYRGQHVYLLPKVLGDRMTAIAPSAQWRHFPTYTRRIDNNDDGRDDFLAIAVGTDTGHGVQVRYRLEQADDGAERLGRWYWALLTDASGETVFQSFNE